MRKLILVFSWLLLIVGGAFLWRGASDYWRSVSSQKEEALEWDNQNPTTEVSADASPVASQAPVRRVNLPRKPVVVGSSVAKLSIPRLGSVLYILEGTNDQDLKRGPGHLEGTVMPGKNGTA